MADRILIGTYTAGTGSEGVYAARWDAAGRLAIEGPAARHPHAPTVNPSFLLAARRSAIIYAVSEVNDFEGTGEGGLVALRWNGRALDVLDRRASGGELPCDLALDAAETLLAVANYGGSVAVCVLAADGTFHGASQVIRHTRGSVDARRQTSGHPHGVCVLERDGAPVLLVPDLGADAVVRYELADGALGAARRYAVAPGSGPRLLVPHPSGRWTYLVNELSNTVIVHDASFTVVQEVSTLPADFSGRSAAAGVRVSCDGCTLYASNRGHDSIVWFRIGADGRLSAPGWIPSGGGHPRAFALDADERFVLVANRDSDNVSVFMRMDTGALEGPVDVAAVPAPSCVTFLPD